MVDNSLPRRGYVYVPLAIRELSARMLYATITGFLMAQLEYVSVSRLFMDLTVR
jgi:hypothetical protein